MRYTQSGRAREIERSRCGVRERRREVRKERERERMWRKIVERRSEVGNMFCFFLARSTDLADSWIFHFILFLLFFLSRIAKHWPRQSRQFSSPLRHSADTSATSSLALFKPPHSASSPVTGLGLSVFSFSLTLALYGTQSITARPDVCALSSSFYSRMLTCCSFTSFNVVLSSSFFSEL